MIFKMEKYQEDPKWEQYFTTKSENVTNSEISYKHNGYWYLKLRLSKLKPRKDGFVGYAYELRTNHTQFSPYDPERGKIHPFGRIKDLSMITSNLTDNFLQIGGIIVKNPVTDALLSLIMMPDSELSKHSGHHLEIGYRSQLIQILSDLWD